MYGSATSEIVIADWTRVGTFCFSSASLWAISGMNSASGSVLGSAV